VGSGTTCQLTVDAVKGVTATFDPVYHQLTVTPAGDGSGSVTSDVGGIVCGATCSVSVRQPTVVTLTASANAGSIFTGWSGDCTGTQATCQITMDGDHAATATFMNLFQLNVSLAGPGGGSVTSDLGAINCGATCSDIYTSGTTVTLTATPDANSTFTGWSGDAACPGTGTCQVLMSGVRSETATFAQILHHLGVTTIGSGGSVTSSPVGITCGATCGANFVQPTQVTLTANPSAGWFFSGWGGDCAGTGACQVTMNQDHTVSATFTQGSGCGKILFTTKRKANVDIYVMNGDGSSQTRLTTAVGSDIQPSWSPDCARIAFTSNATGSEQVYVMNANGTGRTQLTTSGDNNQATWSPDGTKIAFVSDRTGPQKIFVMNANGTGAAQISDTSNASDTHPDWSPNGAKIVFTSSRTGGNQVWTMNADGTSPLRLTKLLKACQDPSWSPDGLKVAIISKMSGTLQVWTLNANGTGAVQVSSNGKTDSGPTWSPDGTKIAFSSTASGHGQIWVVNANGTNPLNVSNATSKDTLPNWS
jgi:Tol biopolymer transport system component